MEPTCTLHKISERFIITSDEEYKNHDLVLLPISFEIRKCVNGTTFIEGTKKVIAQQHQIDFFEDIPEEKLKEIGWFDVEKLSYAWLYDNEENMPTGYPLKPMEYGFQKGFQKALELTGDADRRFTLEDMINLVAYIANFEDDNDSNIASSGRMPSEIVSTFIRSLSQPKSWKVEGDFTSNKKFKISKIW